MTQNEQTIHRFYEAFQKGNYRLMQDLYHDEATFSDAVFQNLNADEVRSMWQMLVVSAKDLTLSYDNVSVIADSGKCRWQAWYTFSATSRKVHNIIDANFQFRDGLIYRHNDSFNFWRWSRMALGTPGTLLGWSPLIRNKVRGTAQRRLRKFMATNAIS